MRKWCERTDAQEQPPPLSLERESEIERHDGFIARLQTPRARVSFLAGGFLRLGTRLPCSDFHSQQERTMDYRFLGASGFKVPALGFGAGTFGGKGPLFNAWGETGVAEARRLIDICLEAGLNLFDTADVYSDGASESILGEAIAGRRDRVLISTKLALRAGTGPNDVGASRHHVLKATDAALKRLGTDYIDLLQLHQFDAMTPVESVMSTLDDLVRAGKVRYIGVSNYSGWQIMKSLAAADRYGYARFVANQTYYSLIGRDYEWDLMPLGLDQGLGAIVWSPLGWGRLTGRIRRDRPQPPSRRLAETAQFAPPSDDERLYRIVDVLETIAAETGKTIPQIAINWLLQRPTVSSVLIGARNEQQLRDNLGAIGWTLSVEQITALDAASAVTPPYPYYPYWNGQFAERAPPAVRTNAAS
jgi:aryl-alcohol dehydrogenase-like predicted oxidoreductase